MILVDWQIQEAINNGLIKVTPYDKTLINPNSLDVRISNHFKINKKTYKILDVYNQRSYEDRFTDFLVEDEYGFVIEPGMSVLATTVETITLPANVCATLEGKSSLARIFLSVHSTGGYVDCGFSGQITLEMTSSFEDPIRVYPGMPIGQLVFYKTEDSAIPYGMKPGSKYQDQVGATQSAFFLNKKGEFFG